MLEDDYFDVDKVKFTLWYLDEERHKLDELKAHRYVERMQKKEVRTNGNYYERL